MKLRKTCAGFAALALIVVAELGVHGQPAPGVAPKNAAEQLVILDTDIGDDIDDAFALALLLQSPEIKLLGITTAFGDTELRARLVDRYLAAVDRRGIPVEAGVATPARNHFTQAAYARQAPERQHEDAVGFLSREIKAHPGQITLIAIGPLFNEQAAIARDAGTFRKLKRVVMMGGSVYRGYDSGIAGAPPPSPEWNIRCDPAGARALLASGVPVFMMPLDSTQIHLTTGELGAIFSHGSPLSDQLTLLYHQWTGVEAWRMPTLFDPVAASYAIRPELCPTKPMHLEVDDQGFTKPGTGEPNAQVCLKADEQGFRELLLKRILSDSGK
ncbi:MAG TPA: nucleoside hydrolase [Terracidiphilus sp.]|nr:nucleoside hydrolase [Terracidiphilus sp.]